MTSENKSIENETDLQVEVNGEDEVYLNSMPGHVECSGALSNKSEKLCFRKFFGLNTKVYTFLIALLLLILGIVLGTVLTLPDNDVSNISFPNNANTSLQPSTQIVTSMSPSFMPSSAPVNITETLMQISGESILELNSSQNKALKWILEEDNMNLTRGDGWARKKGYVPGKHECDWFGITCLRGLIFTIDLEKNSLHGQLPKEIGTLSRLNVLRLTGNHIHGIIPREVGELKKLSQLELEQNEITGTIPQEVGNCKTLNILFLSGNKLNGTIPSSMGSVPEGICSLNLTSLTADCGGDNPEIVCSCCTKCFPEE